MIPALFKKKRGPASMIGGIQEMAGAPILRHYVILVKGAMATFLDIWGTQVRINVSELLTP